jgi:ArsR family transcriptional regulator
MPVPLYQAKAEFFRMLGHPVRIRVLELLQDGPKPVRDLLADIDIEPSGLSQQLAVLRRSGIVTATRHGTTVDYALAGGDVAELMRAARRILTEMLTGRDQLLAELPNRLPSRADPGPHNRQPTPGAPPVPRPAGSPAGTIAGQLSQRCTPCIRYTARTGADHDHQAATRPQSRLHRKLATTVRGSAWCASPSPACAVPEEGRCCTGRSGHGGWPGSAVDLTDSRSWEAVCDGQQRSGSGAGR